MAKAKKRVKSFEVEKVRSGDKKHGYKVTVRHHDRPAREGRGMKEAMPKWEPPQEHFHPSRSAANRHVGQLMNDMSVNPEGDEPDDSEDDGADEEGQESGLEQLGQPNDLE